MKKELKELTISKSFIISLGVHAGVISIIFLFSLIHSIPDLNEPTTITVQSESQSLAGGVNESVEKPARGKTPSLPDRVSQSPDQEAVPDKSLPVDQKAVVDENEAVKDRIRKAAEALFKQQAAEEGEQKAAQEKRDRELNRMAGDVDKALNEPDGESAGTGKEKLTGPGNSNDPLSGSGWSAKARRTLFFPDIQSKIPASYRRKGMGYSVTARIAFDRNGLAIRVDMVTSSGDPTIDGIFFRELRKVRVESIPENRVDTITKTFTISLK